MHVIKAAVVALITTGLAISVGLSSEPKNARAATLDQPEYLVASPLLTQKAAESVGAEDAARAAKIAADAEAARVVKAKEDAAAQQRRTQAASVKISTTPSPVNRSGGQCGYADQIRATFGSAGDWAVSIAWRESNCTPGSKSPTGCWGLFQLCVPLHMDLFRYVCPDLSAQLGNTVALDPSCNIAAAYHLYQGAGTGPWHM